MLERYVYFKTQYSYQRDKPEPPTIRSEGLGVIGRQEMSADVEYLT